MANLEPADILFLISILGFLFSVYHSSKNSKRQDAAESERRAADTATINVKLDGIRTDVKDIKYDITAVKKDAKDLSERLIVVEQSTRSAHKRLDAVGAGRTE